MHSSLFFQVVLAGAVLAHEAFQLDFEVHRGNSAREMKPGAKPSLRKRDDSVELELENHKSFYLTPLKFGSHEEEISVLVDLWSSDLWVPAIDVECHVESRSMASREVDVEKFPGALEKRKYIDNVDAVEGELAEGSDLCTKHGSFDPDESSSFQVNSTAPDFSINYADLTNATGVWAHDTVVVGSVTVDDLSFAVVNETSSNVGVLGLGLPGLETTNRIGHDNRYQYENFPLKLRNQGLIAKNAYSLYLGLSDAETGTVLFGAVDHAKYTGTLETVPIINTLEDNGIDEIIRFEIVVLGITVNSSRLATNITGRDYAALIDTGSTLSYFPGEVLVGLVNLAGGLYGELDDTKEVDCDTDLTVTFDFSGKTIQVPLQDLFVTYEDSCLLGVLSLVSEYIILGNNVLRSMYVVLDLEEEEISLAQARHTNDEDIEIISLAVPSALRAADYSLTSIITSTTWNGRVTSIADTDDDDDDDDTSSTSRYRPSSRSKSRSRSSSSSSPDSSTSSETSSDISSTSSGTSSSTSTSSDQGSTGSTTMSHIWVIVAAVTSVMAMAW